MATMGSLDTDVSCIGIYNRIGRGFPDISAVGHWWLDFNEGEEGGWGGTSMSAPIFASIINRVRDLLIFSIPCYEAFVTDQYPNIFRLLKSVLLWAKVP